jgi:hypothetical protein
LSPRRSSLSSHHATAAARSFTLYSKLDEGKPQAACDFGARRDDGLAAVHGERFDDGSPKVLSAIVPRYGLYRTASAEFRVNDLAAAVAWCEEMLERRGLK